MKALLDKFILWYNRWKFKHNPTKRPGIIDDLYNIRVTQAYAYAGKGIKALFSGDSRLHEAEPVLNTIPGWLDLAVSGSKCDPDGLKYGALLTGIVRPRATVIDWCGNDFLQGGDVDTVLSNHLEIRKQIAQKCGVVLSMELCPLGGDNPINVKIAQFNQKLAAAVGNDLIKLNDILAPGGSMLPQYDCGDHIHFSLAAFTDAIIPRTQALLALRGIS